MKTELELELIKLTTCICLVLEMFLTVVLLVQASLKVIPQHCIAHL